MKLFSSCLTFSLASRLFSYGCCLNFSSIVDATGNKHSTNEMREEDCQGHNEKTKINLHLLRKKERKKNNNDDDDDDEKRNITFFTG